MKKEPIYLIVIIGISTAFILAMVVNDLTKDELKKLKSEHKTEVARIQQERDSIAAEKQKLLTKIDSLKKVVSETPAKIETIKIKYIEKRSDYIQLPVTDRVRIFADRISKGGAYR